MLEKGPEVRFQILPLFPMGKNQSFSKAKEELKKHLGQAHWLDPLVFDMSSKISGKLDNALGSIVFNESAHGVPVLLVFLPSKAKGKPDFNRSAFKNLATRHRLASQCIENANWESFPSFSKYPGKELSISIQAKVGSQWKVFPGLAEKGTYFIAFDVSLDKIARAAVYLVGSNGTIFKQNEPSPAQTGETINNIGQLIIDTVEEAVKNEGGEPIRHLVISRDGRFQRAETISIEKLAPGSKFKISMVEVTKSGPSVYRMIKLLADGTVHGPDSGRWWKLDQNTANLCTTGTVGRGETGLSRPITVTKIKGDWDDTSLEQIVEWMYQLSRLTAYSSKPTRLPIHLHLADRSAKDYLDGIEYPHRRGIHAA